MLDVGLFQAGRNVRTAVVPAKLKCTRWESRAHCVHKPWAGLTSVAQWAEQ